MVYSWECGNCGFKYTARDKMGLGTSSMFFHFPNPNEMKPIFISLLCFAVAEPQGIIGHAGRNFPVRREGPNEPPSRSLAHTARCGNSHLYQTNHTDWKTLLQIYELTCARAPTGTSNALSFQEVGPGSMPHGSWAIVSEFHWKAQPQPPNLMQFASEPFFNTSQF